MSNRICLHNGGAERTPPLSFAIPAEPHESLETSKITRELIMETELNIANNGEPENGAACFPGKFPEIPGTQYYLFTGLPGLPGLVSQPVSFSTTV